MIFAKTSDAANYKGFSPLLDRALEMLTAEALDKIGTTTVHFDGDRLYATRNVFVTKSDDETFYESHRKYLDIHAVIKGEERMDIANPADLTVDPARCNPDTDFVAYTPEVGEHQSMILRPGTFLVAFTDDAHRVGGQVDGPSDVEKIVFKIAL